MLCNHCGHENKDQSLYCANCGKKIEQIETVSVSDVPCSAPVQTQVPPQPAYVPSQPSYAPTQPTYNYATTYQQPSEPVVPPEYKPISAWGYYGYQLLFSIPLIGFIMLLVFSCGGAKNINLRNFARSYWCGVLIAFIVFLVVFLIGLMTGFSEELVDAVESVL